MENPVIQGGTFNGKGSSIKISSKKGISSEAFPFAQFAGIIGGALYYLPLPT